MRDDGYVPLICSTEIPRQLTHHRTGDTYHGVYFPGADNIVGYPTLRGLIEVFPDLKLRREYFIVGRFLLMFVNMS